MKQPKNGTLIEFGEVRGFCDCTDDKEDEKCLAIANRYNQCFPEACPFIELVTIAEIKEYDEKRYLKLSKQLAKYQENPGDDLVGMTEEDIITAHTDGFDEWVLWEGSAEEGD